MTRIFTRANVPPELERAWLQHLRDFDTAHPGCHFEVAIDGSNLTMAEMIDRLQVEPALTFQQLFERKR